MGYIENVNLENGIAAGTPTAPSTNVLSVQPYGGTSYATYLLVTTTATLQTIKGSSGLLLWAFAQNLTTTLCWLHFYDHAGGATFGTTSDSFRYGLPPVADGPNLLLPYQYPRAFVNEIQCAVTANSGGTDRTDLTGVTTTAPIVLDFIYI